METRKIIVALAFIALFIGVYNGVAGHYEKGSFFLLVALIQFYLLRNNQSED